MKTITYNGQSVTTEYDESSTIEIFEKTKNEYYSIPNLDDVKSEIYNILCHNSDKKTLINNYFLKSVHDKVKLKYSKWTIEDMFNCKDIFDIFYSKTLKNDNVFPMSNGVLKNVMTAVRLGGKGYVSNASYFPISTVRFMINKYCIKGGNYYDYSCGWGDRLLGALSCGVNYFGTDPNYQLTEKLNEIDKIAHQVTHLNNNTKIYTQGSEKFITELENNIDFAFTSPPYFDLEDYKIGEQSYKIGTSYDYWIDNYMTPTLKNCFRYIKNDGYLAINIKNSEEHNLLDDCIDIAISVGFKFLGFENLSNISRFSPSGEVDNDEKIAIFSKGSEMPKELKPVSLW